MGSEEQQDWIDRVMAREVWEPPSGFAAQVVARSMALPRRTRPSSVWGLVPVSIAGVVESAFAHLEGYVWTLRQLSHLMRGGHGSLR